MDRKVQRYRVPSGGDGRGNQPLCKLSHGLGALDGEGVSASFPEDASWFGFDSLPSFSSPPHFAKAAEKVRTEICTSLGAITVQKT